MGVRVAKICFEALWKRVELLNINEVFLFHIPTTQHCKLLENVSRRFTSPNRALTNYTEGILRGIRLCHCCARENDNLI